ncbi:hypothetical protein BFL35_05955 [Clavibacter michiganensis]|nr:hypothetical protein BFL35_05955 [Clavibacter michiganensis]
MRWRRIIASGLVTASATSLRTLRCSGMKAGTRCHASDRSRTRTSFHLRSSTSDPGRAVGPEKTSSRLISGSHSKFDRGTASGSRCGMPRSTR